MSTQIRKWGIALITVVSFTVPRLTTQAVTTTAGVVPATSASSTQAPATLAPVPAIKAVLHLKITAYSSSPDETKDYGSPFITADGTYVHDGVVATNILPFGTKVMIPSLFGNKVFTVNDRMSRKLMNNLDIWMVSKASALVFGVHSAQVVVLDEAFEPVADATATANQAAALFSMAIGSKLQGPSVRQL